jgi:4-nitrophenyl phosphatase
MLRTATFNSRPSQYSRMTIRGAVLDVDGTLVRGEESLAGADRALSALERAGVDRLLFSNNPTAAPPAYVDRLARAGLSVAADEVVTAGTTAVRHLGEHHADDRLLLVGETGLCDQLTDAGLAVVDDPADADAVVASIDRNFGYADLRDAYRALADGSTPLIGTDPDVVIPTADGDLPGSGAIVRAVAAVADRDPDVVLGKPSRAARALVRERLPHPPEQCLVVGDRLDTDIALGARAGMTTALVLTGVTDRADLADAAVEPDHVLETVGGLAELVAR